MGRVAEAWVAAVGRLGGDVAVAKGSSDELERRYAEPHRRYHTSTHIEAVLADSEWLGEQLGLDADERAVVALAACAHDVVYDAKPGEDERASAHWARQALARCGVAATFVERVEHLVLQTLTHSGDAGDLAAAALLDADLAVLGAEPEAYAEYVVAVRDEYRAVADDQWRIGRSDVLASLSARHPLFLTESARLRWEEQARSNVERELRTLRTDPRPSR